MPEALSKDQQWERMKYWLTENIASIRKGDLSRLPDSFVGEHGETAITAYESCLEAMKFLEQWDKYGLEPGSTKGHGE